MKAEHRHHLKANVVAESLKGAYESIKHGPSRRSWIVIGVIALIVLVFFIWRFFSRSGEESTSSLWARWDGLSTPNQVKQFAENKDDQHKPPARVARFQQARMDLNAGLVERASNPKSARERLQAAANAYESLAGESGLLPLQVYEALHGAAKAYEGMPDNGKAQEIYQRIIDKFPDTPLASGAQASIERLKKTADTEDAKELDEQLNPKEKQPESK